MSDETIFCDICGVAQKSVRGLAIHKGRMHPDAPISEPIADAEFDQPISTTSILAKPVQVIPKVDAIISPVLEDDMEEPVNDDEMYPSAMDFPKVDPSILGIREVLVGSLVQLTNGATTWRIENGQAILATLAEPLPCTVKHRYLSNDVWTLYLEANGAKDLFLLCLEQDVLNGSHVLGRLGAPVEALPKEMPSVLDNEVPKAVETPVKVVVAEEVICQENAQELDEVVAEAKAEDMVEFKEGALLGFLRKTKVDEVVIVDEDPGPAITPERAEILQTLQEAVDRGKQRYDELMGNPHLVKLSVAFAEHVLKCIHYGSNSLLNEELRLFCKGAVSASEEVSKEFSDSSLVYSIQRFIGEKAKLTY